MTDIEDRPKDERGTETSCIPHLKDLEGAAEDAGGVVHCLDADKVIGIYANPSRMHKQLWYYTLPKIVLMLPLLLDCLLKHPQEYRIQF